MKYGDERRTADATERKNYGKAGIGVTRRFRCGRASCRCSKLAVRVAHGTLNTLPRKTGLVIASRVGRTSKTSILHGWTLPSVQSQTPRRLEIYSETPNSRPLRVLNFAPVLTLDCLSVSCPSEMKNWWKHCKGVGLTYAAAAEGRITELRGFAHNMQRMPGRLQAKLHARACTIPHVMHIEHSFAFPCVSSFLPVVFNFPVLFLARPFPRSKSRSVFNANRPAPRLGRIMSGNLWVLLVPRLFFLPRN